MLLESEFDDDLPDESVPNTVGHHPGVDDGFFSGPPTSPESNKPEVDTRIGDTDTNVLHKRNPNGFPIPRPLLPVPTAPGLNPGVVSFQPLISHTQREREREMPLRF